MSILLNWQPHYVLDCATVVTYQNLFGAGEQVRKNIYKQMIEIEIMTGRRVIEMYIGKTFIRQLANSAFDPGLSATWRLANGINGRYRYHLKQSYGRSGLVVVGVVTSNSIISEVGITRTHEDDALLLEGYLIKQFMLSHGDLLANKGTTLGRKDGGQSIAYAIYVAFTLSEQVQFPTGYIPSQSQWHTMLQQPLFNPSCYG